MGQKRICKSNYLFFGFTVSVQNDCSQIFPPKRKSLEEDSKTQGITNSMYKIVKRSEPS